MRETAYEYLISVRSSLFIILSNASMLREVVEYSAQWSKKKRRSESNSSAFNETFGMTSRSNRVSKYSVSRQYLREIGQTASVKISDNTLCPAPAAIFWTFLSYFRRKTRTFSTFVCSKNCSKLDGMMNGETGTD